VNDLVKCSKPDCLRRVRPWYPFCCMNCESAAAGAYEIDHHTTLCDKRAAVRTQVVERSCRAGKRAATQLAIAEALRDGEHVHFAEPGATYCVNAICPDLPADHPAYQQEWNLNLT
jgi:hypothetical protein